MAVGESIGAAKTEAGSFPNRFSEGSHVEAGGWVAKTEAGSFPSWVSEGSHVEAGSGSKFPEVCCRLSCAHHGCNRGSGFHEGHYIAYSCFKLRLEH